jgi:leader peptidase (prepilin peptidase) / N-methyltransferase
VIPVVVGLLGLVLGSFLNIAIHRPVPLGRAVAWPSWCPFCGTLINAFDNVLVLSYLALRGRWRRCKARISPRYPLVEGSSGGLLFGLTAYEFGLTHSDQVGARFDLGARDACGD